MELLAFYTLEPLGVEREDYRAAHHTAQLMNLWTSKKSKELVAHDVLLRFKRTVEKDVAIDEPSELDIELATRFTHERE